MWTIIILFVGIICSIIQPSQFQDIVNKSPCPNYFQYGLYQGKLVGSMELIIPRTKVYGFNVTQIFIPMVTEVLLLRSDQLKSQLFVLDKYISVTNQNLFRACDCILHLALLPCVSSLKFKSNQSFKLRFFSNVKKFSI